MKINVEYSYNQNYLPSKRHRKIRTREVEASTIIDIKELTADEFPVAFIIHKPCSFYPNMKSCNDYDESEHIFDIVPQEIRTYNDRLYMAVRITHGVAISGIFEQPEKYIKSDLNWYIRYHSWTACYCKSEFTDNSIIVDDDKSSFLMKIYELSKSYVIYDNKVWQECGEPLYNITTFGLGHNHGGTGFFIEHGYNPNISKQNYFNALQYDEAVAYGKLVAARRGDTESIDRIGMFGDKKEYIEVLMPECVKRNPNVEHGDGCKLMNDFEQIIQNSDSAAEAGIFCMLAAFA